MKRLLLLVCGLMIGVAMLATDAEARKLGGGRSIGAQRSTPPSSAATKPSPQQAAPGSQATPAAPAQPAPSGFSRWLPMLGGLAIGGLLGSMLGGFGGFGGILLIALLAIGAVLVFKAFARRREEAAPSRPVQLAGMGNEKISMPQPQASGTAKAGAEFDTRSAKPNVPAGFDTASFLRGAKLNFVKLQVANDAGKLDEIREFTTAEMFSELNRDVQERASSPQQTDVVGLEADLLEIATESGKHWASVRFSGMVRETRDSAPVGFEEVWNLVKPADGSSGWLLAGIQQMH